MCTIDIGVAFRPLRMLYMYMYMCITMYVYTRDTCADPECLVRGGQTFTTFFKLMGGGGSKNLYKRAIIGPSGKRQPLKWGFAMAFRWRADDGPTLNADLVHIAL